MENFEVDALWLGLSFFGGLLATRVKLPPLLGFLLTGFVINILGIKDGNLTDLIHHLSDLGVMLLLFTIGLKINVKSLLKREIVETALSHMVIAILLFSFLIFTASYAGLSFFTDLDLTAILTIGFALSFSSTVFVVKILEDKGEFDSFHGKIAIGILIIQDILAVLYLTFSKGEYPSIWILGLPLYLFITYYLMKYLLNNSDHGELLVVFGFFVTFVFGAIGFSAVGLKPDLGALVMGMLLVNHKKNKELYEKMIGFKDFFLIAFFINIGMETELNWTYFLIALAFIPFIFIKGLLFSLIFARYDFRARTALHTSLSLSNFSEFGLIVMLTAFNEGFVSSSWLTIITFAVALSFLVAAPVNNLAHSIYDKYRSFFVKLNGDKICQDQEPVSFGDANCLVIGLGSLGLSAMKELKQNPNYHVMGIDYSHELIKKLKNQGEDVSWGDSTDSSFWVNADFSKIQIVLLAMNDFSSNVNSLLGLKNLSEYNFKVGTVYQHEEEKEKVKALGADFVYSVKTNIGGDFAEAFTKCYESKEFAEY